MSLSYALLVLSKHTFIFPLLSLNPSLDAELSPFIKIQTPGF